MGKINGKYIYFFASEINADTNRGGTHICKWGHLEYEYHIGVSFFTGHIHGIVH